MRHPQSRAFIYAAAGALLFGLSTPFSKLLVARADPLLLAAVYYLSGALFIMFFPGAASVLDVAAWIRRDRVFLAGSALLGGVIAPVLMLSGLRLVDAASASLLFSLEVPFTAMLAALLFREHISRRVFIAAVLAMVSGALLGFEGSGLRLNLGALLVAASCLCWGLDNNLVARIEGVNPQASTVVKGAAAGTFNLLLWFFLREGAVFPPISVLSGAVLVGCLGYGLSTMLYVVSARGIGAARSQVIFSANPFIGAAASLAVFGLGIATSRQTFAAAGMVAALILIYSERHEHSHCHEALEHEHSHSHDDGHHAHEHPAFAPSAAHSHRHSHQALEHSHGHFPDLHHMHGH